MNEQLWREMLDVLKDISGYLEKQDSEQRRAEIDVPPKIAETQKPIKGGDMPREYGPGAGIAKQLSVPSVEQETADTDLSPSYSASTSTSERISKQDDEDEDIEELEDEEDWDEDEDEDEIESDEEEEEEDTSLSSKTSEKTSTSKTSSPTKEDFVELKALLKDIRQALVQKSKVKISDEIKNDIKKAVREESHKILRKMGFTPSRPDVVKLGVDEPMIKKSEDEEEQMKDIAKAIDNLSKKSWHELGKMREQMGLFKPF